MSSDEFAIDVCGVSKCFEIYDHPRDQLKQLIVPPLRRRMGLSPRQYFREFWALREIDLKVRKGGSYGIIGLNGSGKSTLLQIISGTLSPTSGEVKTHGRVAALLELGAGFNPDFTGRENVYLNGSIIGLSNRQIAEKIAWIESFADIGDHFDQPLMTYSSGMQVRVAFAVATAFDPDILIVDEALAVGDAFFQQKCFQRIEQFREKGGTLLFVSHDANSVKQLCDNAILLSHGTVLKAGSPREVIDYYQGLVAQMSDTSKRAVSVLQSSPDLPYEDGSRAEIERPWTKATTITTNEDAELINFRLLNGDGDQVYHLESETDLTVEYRVRLNKEFERPAFGLIVRDRLGRSVFESSTYAMRHDVPSMAKGSEVVVQFTMEFILRAGIYSFSVGVANRGYGRSDFEEYSLLMHDVEQIHLLEATGAASYGGVFNLRPKVSIKLVG
ncbi:ABC transporter ATP-binding protein [Rhizobium sp. VS19-DR104.2]|uniref:ABC transporter ATP-binding protein n=1 Tax=unclassified Rhizobium TaxID=2613769 RepID=UPI001CC70B8D|nr:MULTISPECIES: ABC transporter ATP-binding protein [unclassified Rhizobium]MBZ5761970.1 ABC transporter ATP-binding protein [Rhizobium sp. VS19-DR96]MBZ5768384.1 ABC transporter ATP-binding protein [Rhizobium sp. VS19-DR129.2]MBZ5775654.1 ABC transporter ATP-binding protein [Rhizobium sp. VS19-DRK62.2]MBZ5786848.1 ABC transporter ATP-binding protein [Rhizobium sp. VS19-DR121]MBZ5804418.1 ABC transporter ATP-binding protein [Rhizobium sp. VS19-DR181]